MGKALQKHTSNVQHKVPELLKQGTTSLTALAQAYFVTEVAGQAKGTIEAKRRDLGRFLSFYGKLYGHDRPQEWYASVTREFLKQEAKGQTSQATLARTYASVRHFARWIHKKAFEFPLGLPTDGVKPPREPRGEWKGLSRADQLRLMNAAQTLRVRPGRGTNHGLRDHAAVAVLLGTGLRVSELLGLDREQYTGRGFTNVLRKGGDRDRIVYCQPEGREALEAFLAATPSSNGALFTTRTGTRLDRTHMFKILQRIARQANAQLPPEDRFRVSPHTLRHTFLRHLADEKGLQYARAASGHMSDQHLWRYTSPPSEDLGKAIDELS